MQKIPCEVRIRESLYWYLPPSHHVPCVNDFSQPLLRMAQWQADKSRATRPDLGALVKAAHIKTRETYGVEQLRRAVRI